MAQWHNPGMSLQCEATLLVMSHSDALAHQDDLRDGRVAAVYAATPDAPAVVEVGAALGVEVSGLQLHPAEGWDFIHTNETVLQGVSDLFRGETVVVLVSEPPGFEPCQVDVGDDGWSLLPWSPG